MAIDFGSIIQALGAADQAAQESDPYRPLAEVGDSLGALLIKNSLQKDEKGKGQYDFKDNAIAGLVTGLIGGAFSGLGERYKAKQSEMASRTIADLLSGNGGSVFTRPEGMSPSVFSNVNRLSNAIGVSRGQDIFNSQLQEQKERRDYDRALGLEDKRSDLLLERQTELNKANQQAELEGKLLGALADARTPAQQQRILDIGKALGALPEGLDLPIGAPAKPLEPSKNNLFPGSTNLNQERKSQLQELLDMGVPGGAAQKEVDDRMTAIKTTNKDSVAKIDKARERASMLREIAGTAAAGVSGAGVTGGPGWGMRNALSNVWQLFSSEEGQQRASQSVLESVAPDIVKISRSPGPVSDYEFRSYLGAGPASNKTPEQNRALIERMNHLADYESEYANFLEAYLAEKGTTAPTPDAPGAQAIWEQYKKDHPLFTKQGEKVSFNSNRPSWKEWLGESIGAGAQSDPKTSPVEQIPQGATDTGRTSNGKPVYQLPDGRLWVP